MAGNKNSVEEGASHKAGSAPLLPLSSDRPLSSPGRNPNPDEIRISTAEIPTTSSSSLNEDEKPHGLFHHPHHILHRLKEWPDKPQSLAKTPLGMLAWDLHDVICCLVPAALIVKAGLCVHASKIDTEHRGVNFDQTSQLTLNLVKFNLQLTTLFTIIFVLIIASTLKRFALWKAQQGARIAELEQYQSSVSVTATFKAIWALRAFSWVSVFLLFVWSWYYVGSQASEREYTFQESGPKTKMQLAYFSDNARSPFMDGPLSSFPTVKVTDLTSRYHIYIRRTEAGISKKPFDINGFPITPFYDNTPANRIDPKHMRRIDAQGWLDTSEFSIQHVVNSIGTTLYTNFNDPGSKNFNNSDWKDGHIIGEFTYATTNFLANCSSATLLNQSTLPGLMPAMTISLNMTNSTNRDPNAARTFRVWEQYNNTHSLQATCNITEIHTDVKVKCTAAGCKAVAVRPTAGVPYPKLRTPFDSDTFANEFFNSLLLASGVPDTREDLTMLEADNGWEPLKAALKADEIARVSLSGDLNFDAYSFYLSVGLTNHINTYYTAAMYMAYELGIEQTLMRADTFNIDPNNKNFTFVNVQGAEVDLRYELSPAWIAVDMISNAILLVAAIFAFWLRRQTLAPDVFGYVSSLTRDNPHINMPFGGSALSGMERARRMRDVKVKLGDVGVEGEVGRVVMTYHENEKGERIAKLQRTRTYA